MTRFPSTPSARSSCLYSENIMKFPGSWWFVFLLKRKQKLSPKSVGDVTPTRLTPMSEALMGTRLCEEGQSLRQSATPYFCIQHLDTHGYGNPYSFENTKTTTKVSVAPWPADDGCSRLGLHNFEDPGQVDDGRPRVGFVLLHPGTWYLFFKFV